MHKGLGQIGSELWFLWQQITLMGNYGENGVATFSLLFLIRSFLYLQVMRTCMKARRSSRFGQIGPPRAELSALERLTKSPYTYNRENGDATFQIVLIGSFSYLQVTMSYIIACMSSKYGHI